MRRIVIQTDRLYLREWEAEDAPVLLERICRDPGVSDALFGGRQLTIAHAEQFVQRQMITAEERGWCRWAVQLRHPQPGDPMGLAGFCGYGCLFAPDIELGWTLESAVWGRGLATEAGRAALAFGFGVVGFERVICAVATDNERSAAVARKVGFEVEGTFMHDGREHLRFALANPLADPPRDPAFKRDCTGADSRSILDAPT